MQEIELQNPTKKSIQKKYWLILGFLFLTLWIPRMLFSPADAADACSTVNGKSVMHGHDADTTRATILDPQAQTGTATILDPQAQTGTATILDPQAQTGTATILDPQIMLDPC